MNNIKDNVIELLVTKNNIGSTIIQPRWENSSLETSMSCMGHSEIKSIYTRSL